MEMPVHIEALCGRTVGEVVAEDYRRAEVFKRYGIDFCCGGDRPVKEAAAEKGVSCDELMRSLAEAELRPLTSGGGYEQPDVRAWPPDFLASYIVNVHHRYVSDRVPLLRELTRTVARVHGHSHPEVMRVADLFEELATELAEHTEKEEQMLFPYIEALCAASKSDGRLPENAPEESGWIEALEDDHDHAGALLKAIRTLTHDFEVPAHACNTYRMTYAELEAFEADLHRHVHLENNVLFPAAEKLRQDLQDRAPRTVAS